MKWFLKILTAAFVLSTATAAFAGKANTANERSMVFPPVISEFGDCRPDIATRQYNDWLREHPFVFVDKYDFHLTRFNTRDEKGFTHSRCKIIISIRYTGEDLPSK